MQGFDQCCHAADSKEAALARDSAGSPRMTSAISIMSCVVPIIFVTKGLSGTSYHNLSRLGPQARQPSEPSTAGCTQAWKAAEAWWGGPAYAEIRAGWATSCRMI